MSVGAAWPATVVVDTTVADPEVKVVTFVVAVAAGVVWFDPCVISWPGIVVWSPCKGCVAPPWAATELAKMASCTTGMESFILVSIDDVEWTTR